MLSMYYTLIMIDKQRFISNIFETSQVLWKIKQQTSFLLKKQATALAALSNMTSQKNGICKQLSISTHTFDFFKSK